MGSSRFVRHKLIVGLLAGATVLAVTAVAGPALASPSAGQGRKPLPGSAPRWLDRAHDLGATPSAQRVSFGVLLGMRNQADAATTLQAISDPTSASYGHWLSNAAFNARYAPAGADVAAVQGWLRSQGFQVTTTLPSGMYVEASGTVAQVESTFATKVRNYAYLGKTVRSNAAALTLPTSTPAAVSSVITGVVGIDQGSTLKQPAHTEPGPPPGARYGVRPCSAYYGEKTAASRPPTASTSRTRPAGTCPSSTSRPTERADCCARA